MWYSFQFQATFSWVSFYLVCDIKLPNTQFCFFKFFPQIFFSFSSWKRKESFYWYKTGFFSVLNQWKFSFLFQLLKLRKNAWKNLEKQDWWFSGLDIHLAHGIPETNSEFWNYENFTIFFVYLHTFFSKSCSNIVICFVYFDSQT